MQSTGEAVTKIARNNTPFYMSISSKVTLLIMDLQLLIIFINIILIIRLVVFPVPDLPLIIKFGSSIAIAFS